MTREPRWTHRPATEPQARRRLDRGDSMLQSSARMLDENAVSPVVRAAAFADGPSARAFADYLNERFGQEDDTVARKLEDLYVAFACLSGSNAAAAHLARMVLSTPIGSRQLNIPAAVADDARQIVFERMVGGATGSGKLASYDGRGPLAAWLRVVVAREALTLHQARGPAVPDAWTDELLELAAPGPGAELLAIKVELREACRAALQRAASELPSRDRALLRQHLALGMTVDVLAPVYGAHRATIARWMGAAKDTFLKHFYAELQRTTGLPRAELEALHGLVQSRLDLSLASLFVSSASK